MKLNRIKRFLTHRGLFASRSLPEPNVPGAIGGASVSGIVIGAQKCGTSALWKILSKHPGLICHDTGQFPRFYDGSSPESELDLALSDSFDKKKISSKKIVLRDTTIALEGDNIPEILKYFPNSKFILIVRDHTERCRSAFIYARNKGFETTYESLDEVLDDWEAGRYEPRYPPLVNYIEAGLYVEIIRQVLKVVPRDRLIILRADELREHQQKTCNVLFEFLEVGAFDVPPVIANVTGDARFMFLNKLMRSDGAFKNVVRNIIPKRIRGKGIVVLGKINTRKKSSSAGLSEIQKTRLSRIYSADKQELKNTFNIDLTASSRWSKCS